MEANEAFEGALVSNFEEGFYCGECGGHVYHHEHEARLWCRRCENTEKKEIERLRELNKIMHDLFSEILEYHGTYGDKGYESHIPMLNEVHKKYTETLRQ